MELPNLSRLISFWKNINLSRFGFEALTIVTVLLLIYILWAVIKYFYGRKTSERILLELTFPADNHKSAFATEQLYILLHTQAKRRSLVERLLSYKKTFSLELVSSAREGIRYVIAIPENEQDIIQRSLLSYLSGIKVRKIDDYIPENNSENINVVTELKLSGDFILPLRDQKTLAEYDPMAYLTGHMTKLGSKELISFQIVFTPITSSTHPSIIKRIKYIRNLIYYHANLSDVVDNNTHTGQLIGKTLLNILETIIKLIISIPQLLFDYRSNNIPVFQTDETNTMRSNPYEEELGLKIKNKISQNLFETSLRFFVVGKTKSEVAKRASELIAAFRPLADGSQSLDARELKSFIYSQKNANNDFMHRKFSRNIFNQNPILSTSELADLYHFPHTATTQTEDLIKSKSQELPAPLSLKNNNNLDVVFGRNTYGNKEVEIGLTDDERSRHMYLIGQTGSGKSTVIYHMAAGDIAKGRGLAVIDPHGDLAEDLLATIPEPRKDDLIYFNPFDIQHPISINLLEISPDLDGDELELEKELVCESVISVFRRTFNKDENVDAHRIEYILRNAIYTAFTVPDATIFTIYDLLNDSKFQKRVTDRLPDKNLKLFWDNEFGKAGDYQVVKMAAGVTAKVGRFLFSPTAKRILEQPKSTINFEDILDNKKILLCNLAEGRIGEDTSQLLGTMIIAKIQQAAMRRARREFATRAPFYLFVDEFQNFATSSFTKLLSGGRKFGLRVTIAEQSTAQQKDRSIVDVILANTGIVITFRTASPVDEELMLSQFRPQIKEGDIANLPRYQFFMRLAAIEAEDPFSGKTIPIEHNKDKEKLNTLIVASRENYAIVYQKPELQTVVEAAKGSVKDVPTQAKKTFGSISKKRAAADPELDPTTG